MCEESLDSLIRWMRIIIRFSNALLHILHVYELLDVTEDMFSEVAFVSVFGSVEQSRVVRETVSSVMKYDFSIQ